MSDLLPFINKLSVQKFGNTILLQVQEKYSPNISFPAFLISDGTINLTALVIALFFENKEPILIEEPERNIHPYLISKVVDIMREASEKTQIITTTHNPEVVRYSDPTEIFLVHRTKKGYSDIFKPSDQQKIQSFLHHEMGMAELYTQNLLDHQS